MVAKIKHITKCNDIMNKKEACDYLNIGNAAMNLFIKEGGIPYRRAGRCYLFSKEALENWLSNADETKPAALLGRR